MKRTPFQPRIKPLSGILRTCKNRACRNKFTPTERHPFAIACCTGCEIILSKQLLAKAQAAQEKKERKELKARKEAIKPRAKWMAEAQQAFNAFIRERDRLAGYPCISSGKPLDWSGNNVDAGHYRSRGSAPHLRFDERNCHAQSKKDNRYGSGNAADYRIGLIARRGIEEVEALEADNAERKFSIDDLKQIKATYIAKLKALQSTKFEEAA